MFNIISALFVRMIMKRHNKLIKKETAQVVLSLFSVPYCILNNGLVVVLFSPVFFPNYFLSPPLFSVLVLRSENTNEKKKRITSDHLNHILKTPYGEF